MGFSRRTRPARAVRHVRVARLPHHSVGPRFVRPAARGGAHRLDWDHRGAARGRDPGPAPGHRYHAAIHLLWSLEPVRRPGGHRSVDQYRTRKTECGSMTMRNAECGVRNGSATFATRLDLPFKLRIPHSAFRIWVGW